MFIIEFTMGWMAHSTSLLGDSLDMLGDAVMYGLTLFFLTKSQRSKAKVSLFKGIILSAFGLGVLMEAFSKIFLDILPAASTIGWIGGLALFANSICLLLLLKHRKDDLNMKSIFLCSRNDIIANTGVIVASFSVSYFQSKWPDIIVGGIIASLFLSAAFSIIRESFLELEKTKPKVESGII